MNTNTIGNALGDVPIINLVPEKWRAWVVVIVWAFPYVTRSAYSLYHGSGIVGAVKGFLFGTNTPVTTTDTTKTP